jgi:hypothetical protein
MRGVGWALGLGALTALRGSSAPLAFTSGAATPDGSGGYVADGSIRATSEIYADEAVLEFTYLGPSRVDVPLASGELRRQIGLKLRAADTCNVVYVTWHASPTTSVAVSVKRNPGASTHEACGASGYLNLPARHPPVNVPMAIGVPHRLRAHLRGSELTVLADGRVAWVGSLPKEAFLFDGPVGVRTDNGRFVFRLRSPPRS